MGHGGRRRGAVPVLLARRDPDDVTGANLLDRAAFALDAAATRGDDEDLAERMRMPRGAGAGSKVTALPAARAGALAANKGSIRTAPVNQSAGPVAEGCEPLRLISIRSLPRLSKASPPWRRSSDARSI